MTRRAYTPDDFDDLALRVFDLAASLRGMSLLCREQRLAHLPLHDKKAREWLTHLDDWVRKIQAEAQLAALRRRASQRTEEAAGRVSGRSSSRSVRRPRKRRG